MGKGPHVPQSSINTQVGLQSTEADLLKKYSAIAMPGLNTASNYWMDILKGGPSAQAATAPYAQTIAGQTAAAQKQIQNMLPAGGEKNLALAQLPISQAQSVANLYQGLGPAAASQLQALGLGSANAGTGAGGVSANAGGSMANLAGQQAQAKGQMWGGIGSGAGSLMGGKAAAACWVAAELYGGWFSPNTYSIRRWIQKTWWMVPFAIFYSRFGERWAKAIRRDKGLRRSTKQMFDFFLMEAREAESQAA